MVPNVEWSLSSAHPLLHGQMPGNQSDSQQISGLWISRGILCLFLRALVKRDIAVHAQKCLNDMRACSSTRAFGFATRLWAISSPWLSAWMLRSSTVPGEQEWAAGGGNTNDQKSVHHSQVSSSTASLSSQQGLWRVPFVWEDWGRA